MAVRNMNDFKNQKRTPKKKTNGFVGLFINLADKMKDMEEKTRKRADEAAFEHEHGKWYSHFRSAINSAIRVSEERLELQEKLDADPEFARIFRQVCADWDQDKPAASVATPKVMPAPERDWVRQRSPGAPKSCGDQERDQLLLTVYDGLTSRHQEFVREIRKKLRTRHGLRSHFDQTMRDFGLEAVLVEYFRQEEDGF